MQVSCKHLYKHIGQPIAARPSQTPQQDTCYASQNAAGDASEQRAHHSAGASAAAAARVGRGCSGRVSRRSAELYRISICCCGIAASSRLLGLCGGSTASQSSCGSRYTAAGCRSRRSCHLGTVQLLGRSRRWCQLSRGPLAPLPSCCRACDGPSIRCRGRCCLGVTWSRSGPQCLEVHRGGFVIPGAGVRGSLKKVAGRRH